MELYPYFIIVQLISQPLNLILTSGHGAQAMGFGFVFRVRMALVVIRSSSCFERDSYQGCLAVLAGSGSGSV